MARILHLFAYAALIACMSGTARAQTEFRVGYVTSEASVQGVASRSFEEELNRIAPGRFEVSHFPGGALGGEREMTEGLQLGSLDIAVIGASVLGNFVPEMLVTELLFLFRDADHARNVYDGQVGDELLVKLEPAGIVGLGIGEVGFKHLTNSRRPVNGLSDVAGLKIRVVENPVPVAAWSALGALPTPMAFPEVYSALQQGVIDGQEAPLSVTYTTKFWEPNKYLTLTKHSYVPMFILASKITFERLDEDEQEFVRQAAVAAVDSSRRFIDEQEEVWMQDMESNGVEIVREIDTSEFAARQEQIYGQYRDQVGDMVESIRTAP